MSLAISHETPAARDDLIAIAPADIAAKFPNAPFATRHALAGHPLLTLEALAGLARTLPRDHVEYSAGDLAPNQRPEDVRMIDMAPADVVGRIETANAWMVLKRVEAEPAYRALLEDALLSVARQRGFDSLETAGFHDIQGFIFVSSANAVTPFHFDAEENFFVQIRGDKFFHIFNNDDRALVSEEDLEISPAKHRNIAYDPAFETRGEVFAMQAGDGMFVPYLWPHWVRTGGTFSISMAITWKSPAVARNNVLLTANAMLRAMGYPQARPGARPILDALKVGGLRTARALVEPLRRSEAMRRVLRGLVFGRKANYYYNDKTA